MKIDHIVVNINSKYQSSQKELSLIREAGFLYEPKYGKGTSGFKASNIWIGEEYFEMISITKSNGGGWKSDWTELYNNGHRGVVCIFFDVKDIGSLYETLQKKKIDITKPEWLKFKWFFNLFTRTMPWKNSYLPFFHKMPFQFGFQQMKDEKSKNLMHQYMYPNSVKNGILSINTIELYGEYTKEDISLIQNVFKNVLVVDSEVNIELNPNQQVKIISAKEHKVVIYCKTSNEKLDGKQIIIENITIKLSCKQQI